MNAFLDRYIILTKEEKLLVGGILLIVLCGLAVMYFRQTAPAPTPPPAASTPIELP